MQRHYCAKADAQDLRGIHEANDAFHVAMFSACGNPYLVRSLQDYMNLTLPMRAKNLADREELAQSRRQHELMIELLRGRDSWALAQLCVDHMQFSKEGLSRADSGQPTRQVKTVIPEYAERRRPQMCNCTSENPYSRSWLWIPGSLVSLAPRNDVNPSLQIDDPAFVAVELHAAERAALVEIADRIGLELGLFGKRVLAEILGAAGRAIAEVIGAVVIPP